MIEHLYRVAKRNPIDFMLIMTLIYAVILTVPYMDYMREISMSDIIAVFR